MDDPNPYRPPDGVEPATQPERRLRNFIVGAVLLFALLGLMVLAFGSLAGLPNLGLFDAVTLFIAAYGIVLIIRALRQGSDAG